MNAAGIKRLISGLTVLGLALALVFCLNRPALASERADEAHSRLENTTFIRPEDPFGYTITPAAGRRAALRQAPSSYPAAFDLRHADLNGDGQYENYVTPVRLQNPFGDCWAFAVGAAVESSLLSSGLAAGDVNFSEKHLAYFLYNTSHGFAPDDPHSQNGEGLYTTVDPNSSKNMISGDI